MSAWSVWIGGVEANDYYYGEKESAERMSWLLMSMGYDDVVIEEVHDA